MDHVSEVLAQLRDELISNRDDEISIASEVACQYVTDHNDTAAYRAIDREVNRLAKAWDRMIAMLDKAVIQAVKIEGSCENFYGD
jgi:hypothetical protein